jgi:photosystem II stability/assembly factor-like uncharacterized protein
VHSADRLLRIFRPFRTFRIALAAAALAVSIAFVGNAQQPAAAGAQATTTDASLFAAMRWRMIGPHRGGRTVATSGVPGQPNVFYIGVNNGGVWKSTDYGRVWTPIFDDQPTGSIGALAVAPSDPRVIYVGSGEGLQRPDLSTGDGLYKSTDAGKTWRHLGLRDGQQIAAIVVDPRDANRLFVAVLGHPYGPNEERGIFRSTDGGETWQKVLYKDENTGAMDLAFDPADAQTLYAVLWAGRQAPWEIGGSFNGPNSGLFKSTDGGTTWHPLTKGLPTWTDDGLGRIGIGVAPSNGKRLFAVVDATKLGGLYRSDDAGESWQRINSDTRLWGRGSDFAEVRVDPRNPDILYIANVVTWKSTDAGKTFTAFRGAPGGDDYHRVWINPEDPRIIVLASDQGAIITVNGGDTWSSWYNQPTAQFYHVSTDNAFPYRVCGGQQESGSACVSSRGDDGQVTFREWHPVAVEEYGYVAPDPLDPDIVYGGKVTRYDRRTGQVQNIAPVALRGGGAAAAAGSARDYRVVRTQPVLFSPVDPHVLYFASNVLWKTTNGGQSWEQISPDLTRQPPSSSDALPANVGIFASQDPEKGKHRGVIYTIAPSFKDVNRIWIGTDDGQIQLTRDGGQHWDKVTPPQLTPWAKVSLMEASHFDEHTAYAAINTFRLDDVRPHIYRTRDDGKSWTRITTGIPDGGIVNVVREDPQRKGLLFAGSEREVYVSFDDGDRWQSLRLNMPATSIRDLVIKNDDLVVGTHGRSFWILDDITPLRQIDAKRAAADADAYLFAPQRAMRVRWNMNTDTPLPQEEPAGQNPPDGAIIDYALKADHKVVTLDILDEANQLVRRFASTDPPEGPLPNVNIPEYWIRPAQPLSAGAGAHRFVWDLHYAPPKALPSSYPIAAIYRDTPREPSGPWVMPGRYTVVLNVDGRRFTQPLEVVMDPRVKTSEADLKLRFTTAKRVYDAIQADGDIFDQARTVRAQIKKLRERSGSPAAQPNGALADALRAVDDQAAPFAGAVAGRGAAASDAAPGAAAGGITLTRIHAQLGSLLALVESADAKPTTQAESAIAETLRAREEPVAKWRELKTRGLPTLNTALQKAKLPTITLVTAP